MNKNSNVSGSLVLPAEVQVTYIERVHGSSTVRYRELLNSIKGIVELYASKKNR